VDPHMERMTASRGLVYDDASPSWPTNLITILKSTSTFKGIDGSQHTRVGATLTGGTGVVSFSVGRFLRFNGGITFFTDLSGDTEVDMSG